MNEPVGTGTMFPGIGTEAVPPSFALTDPLTEPPSLALGPTEALALGAPFGVVSLLEVPTIANGSPPQIKTANQMLFFMMLSCQSGSMAAGYWSAQSASQLLGWWHAEAHVRSPRHCSRHADSACTCTAERDRLHCAMHCTKPA